MRVRTARAAGILVLVAITLAVSGPARAGTGSFTGVSAGYYHTCALTSAGGVKCWGNNSAGQLGNGNNTSSSVPVSVSGLGSGVAAATAGYYHACALTTGGGAKCWGYNGDGQLGNGGSSDSNVPVDVSGLGSGVAAVSAGEFHTCAVMATSGAAKCWGWNGLGQLGDGSYTDSNAPVNVSGLGSGLAAVSAGGSHTCAVTTGGAVKCWGNNTAGQLGNGSNTTSNVPVNVSGLASGVAAVSAGEAHSCAVTTTGAVKCWGDNDSGQLGDASNTDRNVPVNVSGLGSGVASVAAGYDHSCAVTAAGAVKCWGNNFYGQLGNGNNTTSNAPVNVSGLGSGVASVSAGVYHTCAVTTAGAVKCWGRNAEGKLGNGSANDSNVPVSLGGANPDGDGDGCSDVEENGSNEKFGGLRDPANPWDFFDVQGPGGGPKDKYIDLPNDILGVALHYGGGGSYNANFDRGPSPGPHAWNMTAPDGLIDLANDILGVAFQYQNDCQPPP